MNDLENIKVPSNINEVINSGIEKAVEEKKRRRFIKTKKIATGIAAGIIGITLIGVYNPAIASKLPALESVFKLIQNKVEYIGEYDSYAKKVNQTVYSNGVGVTLSEVFCDGKSLYISYKVESKEPFKYIKYEYNPKRDYDITREKAETIVGKQLDYIGVEKVSFSNKKLEEASGVAGIEGEFINENTFIGLQRYNLETLGENIPNKFNVEISLDSLSCISFYGDKKDQVLKGDWKFSIPVEVDKSKIKEIEIKDKESVVGVNKVVVTPFEIKLETNHKKGMGNYAAKVKKPNGKELTYRMESYERFLNGEYIKEFNFSRDNDKSEKIKIELYKGKFKVSEKGEKIHDGEEIIYSKEINIK